MFRITQILLFSLILTPSSRAADGPTVLFLIGEHEYGTKDTLPVFAKSELTSRGAKSLFVHAKSDDRKSEDCHKFPGLSEALKKADVLFISVRRRYPQPEDMAAIRKWIAAGKPVIAIRTSSHAFGERPKGTGYQAPKGHAAWNTFDKDVLGIFYDGHYGSKSGHKVLAYVAKGAGNHPLMKGVKLPKNAVVPSHLYRSAVTNQKAKVLLGATIKEENADEPIAWTLEESGRVFGTSVGGVEDMKLPWFKRLLVNAIYWSVDQKLPAKKLAGLGKWKLSLKDPEGGVHHPELVLKRKGGTVVGFYTAASDGEDYPARNLKLKGNQISWSIEADTWSVKYRGTIDGNNLTGEMDYDIATYTGTADFTAEKQP
ncbi:MAG: ThuA domain-containing protein [Limisphaerales bacterium]